MLFNRGSIFWCNLSKNSNNNRTNIQRGIRPVIVISNNIGNNYSPTITVIPLTTKTKHPLPTHVFLEGKNVLSTPSVALCEQIITIDKLQIGNKLGELSADELRAVNKSLAIALSLEG